MIIIIMDDDEDENEDDEAMERKKVKLRGQCNRNQRNLPRDKFNILSIYVQWRKCNLSNFFLSLSLSLSLSISFYHHINLASLITLLCPPPTS